MPPPQENAYISVVFPRKRPNWKLKRYL